MFSIIGARLYYVAFEWDNYKNDLLQIFNLRAGGLAIYGGVIGAVITLIVFTKVRHQSFFSMADTGVLGLLTGQIIGRWGISLTARPLEDIQTVCLPCALRKAS